MAVIATQSNYSMGQHRGVYSSSSFDTYRTDVKVLSDGPYFAIKNSEKDDSLPFRDPLILPSEEFKAGTTYFLRLQINKHAFKNMTYAIKLIKPDSYKDEYGFYDEKNYQYLKRVTVNSLNGGNSENVAKVTVYETKTEPTKYFSSVVPDNGVNQSGEGTKEFETEESKMNSDDANSPSFVNLKYNGEFQSIGSFKISLLKNSSSLDSAEIVEVLFTPTKNYPAIIIEKERDNSDWTTFFEKIEEKPSTDGDSGTVEEKKTFNGFETSIGSDVKIYSLKNLLNLNANTTTEENSKSVIAAKPNKISKIGVWGRSNLCLNCNGEEIRIGPRGYYEMSFDETLGLSSFGVLAENESDFPFLIDYEYILS